MNIMSRKSFKRVPPSSIQTSSNSYLCIANHYKFRNKEMANGITEQLNKLKQSVDPKLENLNSGRKNRTVAWGGAGRGQGRKSKEENIIARGIKAWKNEFFAQEDIIEITDPITKQKRTITKPRFAILYEIAYANAVKTGDLSYIKELFDRNEGRAAQPIRGESEDDAPIRIELGMQRILDKVYGSD